MQLVSENVLLFCCLVPFEEFHLRYDAYYHHLPVAVDSTRLQTDLFSRAYGINLPYNVRDKNWLTEILALKQRRQNRGSDGGVCPRNVETMGARVSFRPCNIFPENYPRNNIHTLHAKQHAL